MDGVAVFDPSIEEFAAQAGWPVGRSAFPCVHAISQIEALPVVRESFCNFSEYQKIPPHVFNSFVWFQIWANPIAPSVFARTFQK